MELIVICLSLDSNIVANPLCSGNILEDVTVANMKNEGLYGSVFDFSVDYNPIAVDQLHPRYSQVFNGKE